MGHLSIMVCAGLGNMLHDRKVTLTVETGNIIIIIKILYNKSLL